MNAIVSKLLAWSGVMVMALSPLIAPAADLHNHGRQLSGISGQAVISPNVRLDGVILDGSPVQTRVAVYTVRGRLVDTFRTDAEGRFEVILEPGNYVLVPYGLSNRFLSPVHTPVTVSKGNFTVVAVGYYDPPFQGRPSSGISGQAVISANVRLDGTILDGNPVQTQVAVYTPKGRLVTTFNTDVDGHFEVVLEPGNYVLVPYGLSNSFLSPVPAPVTVSRGNFTVVLVGYYDPPM